MTNEENKVSKVSSTRNRIIRERIPYTAYKTNNLKKVVYTCITGDYDALIEPTFVSKDFDYICFTDNPNITSKVWQIRALPNEVSGLTEVKKQRYVKINPHKILSDYDVSIWVDGNVTLRGNLNAFVEHYMSNSEASVFVPRHPKRNCIYEEAKTVVAIWKDTYEHVHPQVEKYKQNGFKLYH
jgi:hypothetical protein